eukprot:scaffold198387_cov19-Tisochrysis_lutea.AAC.1
MLEGGLRAFHLAFLQASNCFVLHGIQAGVVGTYLGSCSLAAIAALLVPVQPYLGMRAHVASSYSLTPDCHTECRPHICCLACSCAVPPWHACTSAALICQDLVSYRPEPLGPNFAQGCAASRASQISWPFEMAVSALPEFRTMQPSALFCACLLFQHGFKTKLILLQWAPL